MSSDHSWAQVKTLGARTELAGQLFVSAWTTNNETPQSSSSVYKNERISIYNVDKSFPRELYLDDKYCYRFVGSNQFARTYAPVMGTDSSNAPARNHKFELCEVSFLRPSIDPMLDSCLPLKLGARIEGSSGEVIEFRRRFNAYYTPAEMHPWQVEKFFDHIAREYDNLISAKLNASVFGCLLKAARKLLPKQDTTTIVVLDYGIGTGLASEQALKMPGIQLIGVDVSEKMLNICRQRGFVARKCAYDAIPLHIGQVDIAICCFVAQYLFDETPYRELHRVLRNEGILAFNLHKSSKFEENHVHQMLINAGFGRVRITRVIFKADRRERRIAIVTAMRLPRFETGQ